MRQRIVLRWGTPVACHDRWTGKVTGVLLHPTEIKASHLLVRYGLLRPRSFALPWSQVASWDEEEVRLAMDAETLARQAPVLENSHRLLTRATQVVSRDGDTLSLAGAMVEVDGGRIVRLLVRGGIFASRRLLPVEKVRLWDGASVTLELTREQMESLCDFQRDSYIRRQVEYTLQDHAGQEGLDPSALLVLAQGGVVALTGNARSELARQLAERLAASVKGVLEVESGVATDWEIEVEAAQALARGAVAPRGAITVSSSLGRVRLEGVVYDQETAHKAVRLVEKATGVRQVMSALRVEPKPAVAADAVAPTAPEEATPTSAASEEEKGPPDTQPEDASSA